MGYERHFTKSASKTAVDAPLCASAIPKFAVKVVLPTPPLPEHIKIVRDFFDTKDFLISQMIKLSFKKLNNKKVKEFLNLLTIN